MKALWIALALVVGVGLPAGADHVPLSAIVPDVPRDAIPPLDQPRYDPVPAVTWLEADDWVLGFERAGDARAYPIKIMNWHEIVNDTVGGLAVAVTYCPLCRSGLAFDRRLSQAQLAPEARGRLDPETVLSFGNTGALYESNMVMYDRQTASEWFQVSGEALRGPLHGTRLARLPITMMTWAQWRALYPQGQVLSPDTGYNRVYTQDPFERMNYNVRTRPPSFRISRLDERTDPKARVLGLSFDGASKAYDLERFPDGAYADQVGGQAVVLFVQGGAGVAYAPQLEGRALRFAYRRERFVDERTGSTWDLSGRAIAGKLKEKRLAVLPQVQAFWFSWALAHPQTALATAAAELDAYPAPAPSGSGWGLAVALLGGVVALLWTARLLWPRLRTVPKR